MKQIAINTAIVSLKKKKTLSGGGATENVAASEHIT